MEELNLVRFACFVWSFFSSYASLIDERILVLYPSHQQPAPGWVSGFAFLARLLIVASFTLNYYFGTVCFTFSAT